MHLFSKENIYSNPHAISCIHPVIQTSTIILWTELFPKKRREKIQGEILQSSSSSVVFPHIIHSTRTTVFPHAIQQLQDNSTYRINSTTRNTTTARLIPCHPVQINTRHLLVIAGIAPHASKHSTWQNKAPSPTAQAGFQLILPGRNSTPSGSQCPRIPYSSSQAHSYRILPGEIGFFPKGLSIVCPCNTKVSVFQFTC